MSYFEDQKPSVYEAAEQDAWDEIEISDLPPDKSVHHLLRHLKLAKAGQIVKQLSQQLSAGENTGSQQEASDAFDLEITALPPDKREHFLLLKLQAIGQRLRARLAGRRKIVPQQESAFVPEHVRARVRIGRVLTALSLCIVLVLLLSGNIPALRSKLVALFEPPTAVQSASAVILSTGGGSKIVVRGRSETIPITISPALGPVPSSCPRDNTLQNVSQQFGVPVLGLGPIWAMGFAGPSAALIQLAPAATSMSRPPGAIFGWDASITLFIPKGYTGDILLQGASQRGDDILAFSSPNMLYINDYLTLNMRNPGFRDTGEWESTSLSVFVPAAGCYYLQATWTNQTWRAYFAAGLHM